MSETLRQKQSRFAGYVAKLVQFAEGQGYQVTFGEVKRDPRVALANAQSGAGIAHSLHLVSLAVDVNLYRDNRYLAESADHAPLGAFWKGLAPDCRWGGDFRHRPDGNHYSIEHEGRA